MTAARKQKKEKSLHVLPTTQQAQRPARPARASRQRSVPRLTSQERMTVFQHLFVLNQSFRTIISELQALAATHVINPRDLKDLLGLTQEVQTEINVVLLDPVHSLELDDWGHFGKTRTAMEQRLKGTHPPVPPKK